MAFGSGQCFEEVFEDFEDDEQPLLGLALTTSSRLSTSSTHSLAQTITSTQSEQIDTQKTHGVHKHYLPPSWYFRDSKNAAGTLDGVDPDMDPQMFKLLARYSRRLHISKSKDENDKRLLSKTYEHERDLPAVSSDETKICLVQSKRNDHDRQRFAVKVFVRRPRFHHTSVKLYTRRVTTEFRLAHSLDHLNVVRVLDLLHNEHGDLCQVMEYCDGGSLLDLLHQVNWLGQDEANCLLKQLLQAVQYIHSSGVAHRNLKPENILLTGKGVLKITDFSCAECFRRPWMVSSMDHDVSQVSSGLKGTVPYIAPEQFKDTKFDPAKGDVWAVGVVYFATRSGRLPWKRATSDDPLYHKYTRDVQYGRGNKYIDWVSGERCRDMLYSILQPDPKSRHTASQALDSPGIRGIKLCY